MVDQAGGGTPVTPMVSEATKMSLRSGSATLTVDLDGARAGEQHRYQLVVTDETLFEPFVKEFTLDFQKARAPKPPDPTPPSPKSQFDLPNMTSVERSEWGQHDPPFTETTAVRIKQTGDNPDGTPIYSWWWNADNGVLQHNIGADLRSRNGNANTEIIRSVFQQAMLLVGMSALRTHERDIAPRQTDEGEANPDEDNASVLNAEDFVEHTTTAFAPVAWPLITRLSKLRADDLVSEED